MARVIELSGQGEEPGLTYHVVITIRKITEEVRIEILRNWKLDGPEDRYEISCTFNGQEWDRATTAYLRSANAIAKEWATTWKGIFRENRKFLRHH